MLLRIFKGTVLSGRETDFVALCRQQVADRGRSAGLVTFMPGYRRVGGADRFILAASWESEAAAIEGGGEHDRPIVADVVAGIGVVESVQLYDVIPPIFRGIVDAPGGVVRAVYTRVPRDARDRLVAWIGQPRRRRQVEAQRLLLGWAMGEREVPGTGEVDLVAVSAWPSPLVVESVADPGRDGQSIFEAVDEFAPETRAEQYRAIGLELPDELADLGSRRLLAARFATREQADGAASSLGAMLAASDHPDVSVAPLGAPGMASDRSAFVVVARVSLAELGRAERLIADQGGDVILSQRETPGGRDSAVEAETPPKLGDPGLTPGLSPAE